MMLNSLMISCRKATFLVSRKEEHRLSYGERVRLFIHLSMCRFCRRFSKQSKDISRHTHHFVSPSQLSREDKAGMVKSLENLPGE